MLPDPKTAAIVLAAGESSRMGRPKQLLDFGGKPLLRHSVEVALAAGCSPVIVVLGANETLLRTALDGLPVEVVFNGRWAEGMGTSIQAGLQALDAQAVAGAILVLADQPQVSAEFLRGLSRQHRETGKIIVAASYEGTVGVPAFFASSAFPLLLALSPGNGCKGVILAHRQDALLLDCPDAAIDIDTPEDYERITKATA
ncbi:MAG: nucleotidyltransferase family protein [Bryobacteraceae bacterium]